MVRETSGLVSRLRGLGGGSRQEVARLSPSALLLAPALEHKATKLLRSVYCAPTTFKALGNPSKEKAFIPVLRRGREQESRT